MPYIKTMSSHSPADTRGYKFLHKVFLVGLLLKGANAFLELVSGLVLLLLPIATLQSATETALRPLMRLLPEGPWHARLERLTASITPEGTLFAAWYFLSHALVKLLVVVCLVKGWVWAYPLSIAVFAGFMTFQTWEFFHGHAIMYMLLNIMDVFLILLTVNEWRHAMRLKHLKTA